MPVRLRRAGEAALGGLAGACLFLPALSSGRLADDFVLLRTVRRVRSVLWPFSHNDLGQPSGSGHFYRPLWMLVNAGVYQLSHDPLAGHVLNLVLFALVCAEVVMLLRRFAGRQGALLGALLFVAFPSHGESVAWISGNTDLLAAVFGLGAVLAAVGGRGVMRIAGAGVLAAAAMLTKEVAFVFPFLAAVLTWLGPRRGGRAAPPGDRRRWIAPAAMLAGVVAVTLARSFVIQGLGGYGGAHLTARRLVGSLLSFSLAALSAPQLGLLRHPVLLVVPALFATLVGFGVYRLWSAPWRRDLRLVLAGCLWFLVSLLPVLNQPLNLNTRNGDRLLLIPSVGIALAAAVLVDRVRGRWLPVGAAFLLAACAATTVLDARDWNTAGHESRRILAELKHLSPHAGQVLILSVPTDYRAAHLFPDSLDVAVHESGLPATTVTTCAPVHAVALRPGQVAFQPAPDGSWTGDSTRDSPFDVPVLGGVPSAVSAGCVIAKAPGTTSFYLGTARSMTVLPRFIGAGPHVFVYFDGRDMRRTAG